MMSCDHIEHLRKLHFVDGKRIYLQKINLQSSLPLEFRIGQYCIYCGVNLKDHPTPWENKCVNECMNYRNAHLSELFNSDDSHSSYEFNLITWKEAESYRTGDPNFPQRLELPFCPYCGFKLK